MATTQRYRSIRTVLWVVLVLNIVVASAKLSYGLISHSAAMQADAYEDAVAWMQSAYREAQAAIAEDPHNPAGEQILRTVQPLSPPNP